MHVSLKVSLVLMSLVAGLLASGCNKLPGAKYNGPPDFAYTTFDGKDGRLSDLAGKPYVLNFWAAWCGPCVGEFPEFQEVVNAHQGEFTLLSVAVDDQQDPRSLVEQNGYNWTFASSGDDLSGLYGITGIPLTLFVDRKGNVVTKQLGGMDKTTFESNLAKIL